MAWIRRRPVGLVYDDPAQRFDGYRLFSPVRGKFATLLDPGGHIVHRWHHPEGLQHCELLPNGNLLAHSAPPAAAGGLEQIGGSAAALYELDWDSEVVWEYRNDAMHHDMVRLDDGNHLVLAWDVLPAEVQDRLQGGHHHHEDPERMWGDVVLEVDRSGAVVREWRSWEHLDPTVDVLCPLESRREWTHANSIEVLPDGRWLLSFRLTSTIAIVDPSTGAVTRRYRGPEESPMSHQHAATWLGSTILAFDNGPHRRRGPAYSRVVELDVETGDLAWSYQGESLLSFFSFMISGASRLPNGNTFVTEGATGRLFEVTPDGEVVWEYVSPFTLMTERFGPSPAVFRAYAYAADGPELSGRDLEPGRYAALEERFVPGGLPVGEE